MKAIEDNMLIGNAIYHDDIAFLQDRRWQFIMKKIFEKIVRRKVGKLYVFKMIYAVCHSLVIGDAENIYRCSIALAFGRNDRWFPEFQYTALDSHCLVPSIDCLSQIQSNTVINEMFYSEAPIVIVKDRFHILDTKQWHVSGIVDAIEKVGLCKEELLVEADLQLC